MDLKNEVVLQKPICNSQNVIPLSDLDWSFLEITPSLFKTFLNSILQLYEKESLLFKGYKGILIDFQFKKNCIFAQRGAIKIFKSLFDPIYFIQKKRKKHIVPQVFQDQFFLDSFLELKSKTLTRQVTEGDIVLFRLDNLQYQVLSILKQKGLALIKRTEERSNLKIQVPLKDIDFIDKK